MKRTLILVAFSSFLCWTASGFQGGGGESTKKESPKKSVPKKKTSGTTAREQIVIPSWLRQLKDNPIIPGIGLAGIRVGFPERRVTDQLGAPTESGPVKSIDGRILFYRLNYKYKSVMLGFYTNPETRAVRSMRILDTDFNKYGFIGISSQGLTLGISETRLRAILGQPYKTDRHSSCTGMGLGNSRASTYYYYGISFWVCDEGGMVRLIDIPETGPIAMKTNRIRSGEYASGGAHPISH